MAADVVEGGFPLDEGGAGGEAVELSVRVGESLFCSFESESVNPDRPSIWTIDLGDISSRVIESTREDGG